MTPAEHTDRIAESVEAEMQVILLEIVAAAVRYLETNQINVDGDLQKSLYTEVERLGNVIRGEVGASAAHAIFVHEGTRPHWPPVDPLKRWVQKKLGISEAKELASVTFLVRRKIARFGTEAKPFLLEPFRLMQNQIGARLARAAADSLRT